jgi:hypothetical protein
VTLKVTDKTTGDTVTSQRIILQVSVPNSTLNPNQPITGTNGRATVVWTIFKADQVPGHTEAMAFCAPGPGQSFCRTSLSDPSSFTTTF